MTDQSQIETLCQTETQLLTVFQTRLERTENVDIIADDTDFVRQLVITLIACRERGTRVRLAYYPRTFEDAEPRILHLLRGLGCLVHVAPSGSPPPFLGVLFDPLSRADAALLMRVPRLEQLAVHAKLYTSPVDWTVISSTYSLCSGCFPDHASESFRPALTKVADINAIIARLKTRPMYFDAEFEYEQVSPTDIQPQKQLIRRFKHNQIRLLRRVYKARKWPYYEPSQVLLAGGGFSFVTPPVIEEHGGKLIIAEGHTRIYESISQRDASISVLVARNVNVPLPSDPANWDSVVTTDADVDSGASPERLQFTRRIESAAHPTTDWLPEVR